MTVVQFGVVAVTMTAFVLGAVRCTTVDDTLGQNFIPPHQQMTLRVDTLTGIRTYIAQNDSVLSSNQGVIFVGSMTDPVFGRVQASAMSDFFPQGVYVFTLKDFDPDDDTDSEIESEEGFGFNPVADSIFVDFIVDEIRGTPRDGQRINVYEMRDSLRRDSLYFFSDPIETLVDKSKPLFSFVIDKEVLPNSIIERKLEPTAEGLEFMRRIVETSDEVYKTPRYNFHKLFYGLYFAPAPDYPEDGAIYRLSLRERQVGSDFAGMFVWAHNYNKSNPTQIQDTLIGYFRFADNIWLATNPRSTVNLNVNRTTFTYPPAIAGRLNDTMRTSAALETVYVQGLGGVATYLRFSDELVESLNDLRKQDGIEYSAIVINEARLHFPLDEPTIENMNIAPARLGMYYTYGQPVAELSSSMFPWFFMAPYGYRTAAFGPVPIPDYAYFVENTSNSRTSYGGFISRSLGRYGMNITGYVTSLLAYPDHTPREVWLGPEVNTRHRTYSQVALQGSARAEDPIRLVLTYTLIR